MHLHYQKIPCWSFQQNQINSQQHFQKIVEETIAKLPHDFYQHPYLHIDWMQKQQLYKVLQTIPKGVLHHDHFDCNQDAQFYRNCVIDDPIVFVHAEKKQFFVGTSKQAEQKGFISMKAYEQLLGSRQLLVKNVSNFTMMAKQDYLKANGDQKIMWDIFQAKISNFDCILGALHLFKKYVNHVLRKFIANGYQRIQFRALLIPLTQYNENGEVIKIHQKSKFAQAFDEVYNNILKEHPTFTVGFVFFGLLSFTQEKNRQTIKGICQLGWDKVIGIDFVNEQDPYGSLQPYDKLANQVLQNYPNLKLRKVYHCGQTKNHKNRNIEVALNADSARIGHGNNVVQWPQTLQRCIQKNICFEKCLMSNLIFKYSYDARFDASAFIFSVGVPISINPDDPGKFGYQDTTCDYFLASVSYNWSLRHFKAIGLYSIQHAIIGNEQKQQKSKQYHKNWIQWLKHKNWID